MEKILIIYGGKSVEHDISIITALQVMNSIKNDFEILPIYVNRDGQFMTADNLLDINIYSNFLSLAKNPRAVFLCMGEGKIAIKSKIKFKKIKPSCALVCMHGINGEDGSVSGALQLARIPYTCPSIESSAICMDKIVSKVLLKEAKLPVTDFIYGENIDLNRSIKQLNFPIIVKPARCGSSIGISKCNNLKELKDACEIAKCYDSKILLEHFIENGREFNCACLNKNGKYIISKVNEVKTKNFYSFDEKYIETRPTSTFKIDKNISNVIQDLTLKTCKLLECEGVVRVDFLMDDGQIYINEINTIPGSLAFYFFGDMKGLVCELIEEAKKRFENREKKVYVFDSQVLNIFANSNLNKYSKK